MRESLIRELFAFTLDRLASSRARWLWVLGALLCSVPTCLIATNTPFQDPSQRIGTIYENAAEAKVDKTEPQPKPKLAPSEPTPFVHPLAALTPEELDARLQGDSATLGSISVGFPSSGRLFNSVLLECEEHECTVVVDDHTWGTIETVQTIKTAIQHVEANYPPTHPLFVGAISSPRGGHLSPHVSHQSGRDVDLGYYYTKNPKWYARATKNNLDVVKTWALVRALVTQSDVELLLIDISIQKLLRAHAEEIGEDPVWLRSLFDRNDELRPLIRHARGHATHLHVRLYNPIAQETARLMLDLMIQYHLVTPPPVRVLHKVRRGDTLNKLARRYRTTVKAIRAENRLRSNAIRAGRSYRIPTRASKHPWDKLKEPLEIPPRRLPSDFVPSTDTAQSLAQADTAPINVSVARQKGDEPSP